MKAMILAAGKGERFRPIRGDLPKPMVRLAGKPILEHVVDHLREFGIRDFIINLHHRHEAITGYFGDGGRWGVSIFYSFEPVLLGTAGAVKKVAHQFEEAFLVYYGDNLCSCDLEKLQRYHGEKKGLATIVIAGSYDDIIGGVVECGPDGRLTAISEKPAQRASGPRWENGGIYMLERRVIDYIPDGAPSDFARDIFPAVLEKGGDLFCYKAEGYVRGIDTPERFRLVQKEWEEGRLGLR